MMSSGFDRDRYRRRRELTNEKNIRGKYHVRVYLKEIFGFAEHQEKCTNGLGCKLILIQNSDSAVLKTDTAYKMLKLK